jgi:hypothetical protein
VQALNTLREQVGAENELAVAIESPSFEANKKFARALIPKALSLTRPNTSSPFFTRAEFQKDISFLQHNALYFATDNELDELEDYLRTKIDEAKKEANPFYIELEDDITDTDSLGEELEGMYDELVGSEYFVSDDSLTLAVKLYPSGSQTDLAFVRQVYKSTEQLVQDMDPASFHPQMKVTVAGRLLRTLIEIETITKDVKESFGIGVLMLLAVVVAYFFFQKLPNFCGPTVRFKNTVARNYPDTNHRDHNGTPPCIKSLLDIWVCLPAFWKSEYHDFHAGTTPFWDGD